MNWADIKLAALGATWAIEQVWLSAALQLAKNGEFAASRRAPTVRGNVAVIPVYGMITQRGGVFDVAMGGTPTQSLEAAFSRALNSDRVSAIVLDVDSPGGTTAGVQAASNRIFEARGTKPIIAVANSLAASAAYWIASSADTFVAAPGSDVGSIGVFRMHEDLSGALSQAGINITFIEEPQYKTEGNPYGPLSDDAIEHQKAQVHETFRAFNSAVARNRNVAASAARKEFGQGRMYHPQQAKERNMIDRIGTMDQILGELGVGRKSGVNAELASELCAAWETGIIDRVRKVGVERLRLKLDQKMAK